VADVAAAVAPAVPAGVGLIVRSTSKADNLSDAARATKRIVSLSDEAITYGKSLIENLGEQTHHVMSMNNSTWTKIFEETAKNTV